jgi:hypothetical protein
MKLSEQVGFDLPHLFHETVLLSDEVRLNFIPQLRQRAFEIGLSGPFPFSMTVLYARLHFPPIFEGLRHRHFVREFQIAPYGNAHRDSGHSQT